ncbi:uncharacterized protein LOC131690227 [Topomyia yanbarensis]|uniref:uncharacterized protein LOC131690227 n=1 Tax=Topomyia yanbarensis TaxID=2498891 RepID=UPI00273AADBE|nr:uncharacterized protein LOC131690227 [Topomyia yanbarensis]
MNRWLTLVCILGCLGGAFTMYAAISVGSSGLVTLSNSLQQIAGVVATYQSTLNTARNQVFVGLTDLMGWVNITYTAMNKTYGANQTMLRDFVSNLQYFNQTIGYGDQSATSAISNDLTGLSQSLRQAIDNIIQYYNMLLGQMPYNANSDNCTIRNATQMINVPTSLVKLGQCLQINTATVTAYVPPIMNIISVIKSDFVSFVNQLKICNAASITCQNYYFEQVYMESSTGNSMLYMLNNFISMAFQDAYNRNSFCGQLVQSDIQDAVSNLTSAFSLCAWPPQ